MGLEAIFGLVGLVALACALGTAALRVNHQVAETTRVVERLRHMRSMIETLRAEAAFTRTAVDATADSVSYLGHR